MNRRLRLLRTACCIALSLSMGVAAAAPPRPLLWKVSDGDNDVYLLGSFHLLKPGDYPLAASVESAFVDAESVLFEVAPDEMDITRLRAQLLGAAQLSGGRKLAEVVPAPTWSRLQAYADSRGIRLAGLSTVEPWYMAMVISLTELARIGYDAELGLDRHFIGRAAKAGKATGGLETAGEQIAALDSMSELEQAQYLAEALDESDEFKTRVDALHGAWRRGDAAMLEQEMATAFQERYARLYQRVNVARNQAWLPRVRRLLDARGADDALVIVGSMHLLGSDGLVSQLRARGYRVQRL